MVRTQIYLTESEQASLRMLARRTGLMDALIAASAEFSGSTLVTLNDKHYPMLESVLVPYRK